VEGDGRVLYESDFAEKADGWRSEGGQWAVADGLYQQTRRGQGLSSLREQSWSDYTFSLKARKHSGGEGFLIAFGRRGAERYWWNLGGWGNTQYGIEFNQTPIGRPDRGRIENDRWYDIRSALKGNRIQCYLDGKMIHDAVAATPQRFFAVAGRYDATGDVVLKAINTVDQSVSANL